MERTIYEINQPTIKYPARASQLISFEGMNMRGGIHPTDIDGAIEYKGIENILFEMKRKDAVCPKGQQLLLERRTRQSELAGVNAFAIIAEHDETNPYNPVKAKDCIVRAVYAYDRKTNTFHWYHYYGTVGMLINRVLYKGTGLYDKTIPSGVATREEATEWAIEKRFIPQGNFPKNLTPEFFTKDEVGRAYKAIAPLAAAFGLIYADKCVEEASRIN